jgi:Holliday junction resolvase RusA-like endonuclease
MAARTFNVFVRGIPKPQGSGRAFLNKRTGQPIYVSKTRNVSEWRQAIKDMVAWQWEGPPIDGAVALSLVFISTRPKSAHKRVFHTVTPDVDKLTRAVGDALKGVAYTDDSRVISSAPTKLYGDEPGVHILLWEIESPDDLFVFYLAHGQRVFDLLNPPERSRYGKSKGNTEEGPPAAL